MPALSPRRPHGAGSPKASAPPRRKYRVVFIEIICDDPEASGRERRARGGAACGGVAGGGAACGGTAGGAAGDPMPVVLPVVLCRWCYAGGAMPVVVLLVVVLPVVSEWPAMVARREGRAVRAACGKGSSRQAPAPEDDDGWLFEHVTLETRTLRFSEHIKSEYSMMDWTRLVSNLLHNYSQTAPKGRYAPRVHVRIFEQCF